MGKPPTPGQQDSYKKQAAAAALDEVLAGANAGHMVGIGTGSTADHFIDLLARRRVHCAGFVASSIATARRLRARRLPVRALGGEPLGVYIDGCDEADPQLRLIKGGGGALSREKLLASRARRFICIADHSKRVQRLGAFPLPLEVMPVACAAICQMMRQMGGDPQRRAGFTSDNGLAIIDVANLDLSDPEAMEAKLSLIPGVLSCGLFTRQRPDLLILSGPRGTTLCNKSSLKPNPAPALLAVKPR